MISYRRSFRKGRPDDAPALAELVNYAGDGLPLHLWEQMREPGESAWDVGRRRAGRSEGSFSYSNAVVLDADDKTAACLIGYPLSSEPEPVDDTMPAMFVPLQELENEAPDTWYVNVLAAYPDYRGKGFGGSLLGLADEIAAWKGKGGLSVIVADANKGARRLYERCGFTERATRPMVKGGWRGKGENWVLLTKSL